MPSKEELKEHVKIGFEYAAQNEIPVEGIVDHLTNHLWAVIGMWLKYSEEIYQKKKSG
ncbi:hypothetical protein LCGC14_0347590 [marine sediment metagenome]|uniref:Uncharacterized protein n=1 Tax=marine sediment metagenome TaxID=412755 RepID=A0A0F9TUQ3_9ZZZZ